MSVASKANNDDDNTNNKKDDIGWTEHNVHDYQEEDTDFVFSLFETNKDEYDTTDYDFSPKLQHKPISLRGSEDMNHSTGLAVWLGSEVLCDYLLDHADLVRDKRVIELGAGVGLCGIVAHQLGAKDVLLTDGDVSVLENVRYNVQQNQIHPDDTTTTTTTTTISCPQLIWGQNLDTFLESHGGPADVIIASDVTYITKSIEPMWQTVRHLLLPDGIFLWVMKSSSQDPSDIVPEIGSRYGFTKTNKIEDDDGVYLFRRRKSSDDYDNVETPTEETEEIDDSSKDFDEVKTS
mmetsp:Transcript_17925/g.26528  ORF Transcript_17925/g.26528 Transcript_17925/m.26528 type:complete len:292 (-) Transcript_17925:18-893(-)